MCGIAGYINRNGAPARVEVVRRMRDALEHRGPDDAGDWQRGCVAMGHRRLSIVDLTRGHQPMHTEDGSLHIVYNGEAYNHRELRRAVLRPPDEGYRTTCDTETLLHAYRQLGAASVEQLRGMFAFAVHDSRDHSLFLARDRLGIKPLYYFCNARLFAFASEIKALLAHPEIEARVNEERLGVQLALKYGLDDQTLFEGIRALPPGHWMRVDRDGVKLQRYWNLDFNKSTSSTSFEEAAEEFVERFDDSVRARLMADVPLGVFLSGGIDSSVIAASMERMVSDPIRSFSISFADERYDESPYSRLVARSIGSVHREVKLTPEEWFGAWPHMVYHEDEPIAHPSSISLHFLARRAADEVKVVLTGEGADELLAGYERYPQTLTNLRFGRWLPDAGRRATARMIDLLPDTLIAKRKAVRTALYLPCDIASLFLDNYAAMRRAEVAAALRPGRAREAAGDMYAPFAALMRESGAEHTLDQLLYADIKTYLVELLMKQDQMSMSASLESRVPFLDHHLVEFACRLPVPFKLKGFRTKRILRRALGDRVPRQIVERPKMGFPTPTRSWFRGTHHETMRNLLLGRDTMLVEYVERGFIENVLERHRAGRWDLEEQIWTLGNLEMWLQIFIAGRAPDAVWQREWEGSSCASSG